MSHLYEMRVYNRPPGETPTPMESPSISIETLESVVVEEVPRKRPQAPPPSESSNFGSRCVNFWMGFVVFVFFSALFALLVVCKFAPHRLPGGVARVVNNH